MKCNFEIVKITRLSGRRATFYTAFLSDEETTLFEQFLLENKHLHQQELSNIVAEIKQMAHYTGARIDFFQKPEGKAGESIFALYAKQLRLYCFRIDNCIVLLGGGGWKTVRTWQEDVQLTAAVQRLRFIARQIDERLRQKEIRRSADDLELTGDLTFQFEDETDD
jgi:hypothetical protein